MKRLSFLKRRLEKQSDNAPHTGRPANRRWKPIWNRLPTSLRELAVIAFLSVLSGLAAGLAWPPDPHPYLSLVIPVVMAYIARRYRRSLFRGWLAGMGMGLSAAYFQSHWLIDSVSRFSGVSTSAATVEFTVYASLFFWKYPATIVLFSLLLRRSLLRKWIFSRGLAFAFIATSAEILAPQLFPWHWGDLLALDNRIAQMAEFTGVSGITFFLFYVGFGLYRLLPGIPTFRSYPRRLRRTGVLRLTTPFLLITAILLYGRAREQTIVLQESDASKATVAMLQTNTPPAPSSAGRMLSSSQIEDIFYRRIPALNSRLNEGRGRFQLDLVIMPESAVPYYSSERNELSDLPEHRIYAEVFRDLIAFIARSSGAPVLYNEILRRPINDEKLPFVDYNAATIMDADGRRPPSYFKQRLIPGEEHPLRHLLFQFGIDGLIPANLLPGRFQRGRESSLLRYGDGGDARTGRLLPLICGEALYSGLPATFPRDFDFIVNLAQDGWYGPLERHQSLELTRMRAIEYRTAVVRSSNSGFSAVIGPSGRMLLPILGPKTTGLDVADIQVVIVPVRRADTFFARFGHLWMAFVAAVIVLGAIWRIRAGSKTHGGVLGCVLRQPAGQWARATVR